MTVAVFGATAVHAEEPVIEFEEAPGELHRSLRGAQMRVYADGLVEVTRPPYMKSAGTRKTRLPATELDDLISALLEADVATFDPEAVGAARRASAARRERGTNGQPLEFSSDPEVLRLRVRLPADPSGRRVSSPAVDASVRWVGLRQDRARFPDVEALQKLAAVSDRLRALMDRPVLGGTD